MRPFVRAAALIALFVFAPRLRAQATPEQVVQRYFDTFKAGDFAANAAMMDPAALDELKQGIVAAASIPGAAEDPEFQANFGVRSLDELKAMPPQLLYQRMLTTVLGQGEMRELLGGSQVSVLGHVMEGDTAHVVYRMRMNALGVNLDQVQVAPLRQVGGEWRVLLTGSFAGMISAMSQAGMEEH